MTTTLQNTYDRTNVTPTGYDYNGNTYATQTKKDGAGNDYKVDVITGPAKVATPAPAPTVAQTYKDLSVGTPDATDTTTASVLDQQKKDAQTTYDTPIDEATVRKSFRDRIQSGIDAINGTYSSLLGNARIAGASRIGQTTAVNARGGALGSDFAKADNDTVTRANEAEQAAIEQERLGKVNALITGADDKATTALTEARLNKTQAGKDILANLTDRKALGTTVAQKLASLMLTQGFKSYSELDPAKIKDLATQYGVTPEQIQTAFETAQATKTKSDADLALTNAKTKTELDANRYKTIADGAQLLDTTTGKVIENFKGSGIAGGAGTGRGLGVDANGHIIGLSTAAQTWVDKINKDGGKPSDYVTGTSKEAQALRNEIQAGINAQGGYGTYDKTQNVNYINDIDNTIADLSSKKNLSGTFRTRTADNSFINWSANENTDFVNQVDLLTGQLLKLDGNALKSIFGPQISNSDAATIKEIVGKALNPRNQTPATFQASLDKISKGLQQYRNNNPEAMNQSKAPVTSTANPEHVTKMINGVATTLYKGADGQYYPAQQ